LVLEAASNLTGSGRDGLAGGFFCEQAKLRKQKNIIEIKWAILGMNLRYNHNLAP
jgi:hypothetical protein